MSRERGGEDARRRARSEREDEAEAEVKAGLPNYEYKGNTKIDRQQIKSLILKDINQLSTILI